MLKLFPAPVLSSVASDVPALSVNSPLVSLGPLLRTTTSACPTRSKRNTSTSPAATVPATAMPISSTVAVRGPSP